MADGTRAEDRLRASEARLSEAQALAQLGSWEWDVVAGTVSWSDELYRIHGTRRGSFIPSFEAYLKLVHPDDRERVRSIVERAFADRQQFEFEERVVRPDGEERVLASRGRVFTDDAGEVVRLVGVCRDVTDQRQAAAALREAEERFRGAFETAAIGIALVSPDGRFLEVNEALCEIVGYDADELVRKTFQDITHPDDLEADLAYVRQVLAGEIRTYQMEKRYFHSDGHLVWILLSVSLVRDEEGEPLYFVSQIEDVTERKRAEAASREAEERFRRAFEDAGVGMALIGVGPENAGRFLEVNDALLGISGHSREQLLSARFADIAHPDDLEADFGAGFASFYYLKHLTFDYLKIDGEFIEDLPKSKTNQLVVRAVVEIARGLGKKTIAEFVGDDKSVELLRHYGVDYAQGFHVGRPQPIGELELLPA